MQRRDRPWKVGVTSCETNETEVAFPRSFNSLPFTYDAELDRGALRVDAVQRLGSITGQDRHAAAHFGEETDLSTTRINQRNAIYQD